VDNRQHLVAAFISSFTGGMSNHYILPASVGALLSGYITTHPAGPLPDIFGHVGPLSWAG